MENKYFRRKMLVNLVLLIVGGCLLMGILSQVQNKTSEHKQKQESLDILEHVVANLEESDETVTMLTEDFHASNQQTLEDIKSLFANDVFDFLNSNESERLKLFTQITEAIDSQNLYLIRTDGTIVLSQDKDLFYKNFVTDLNVLTQKQLNKIEKENDPVYVENNEGSFYFYAAKVTDDYYLAMGVEDTVLSLQIQNIEDISTILKQSAIGSEGFLFAVNSKTGEFIYFDDGQEDLSGKSITDYGLNENLYQDDYAGFQTIKGSNYYCVSKEYGDYTIVDAAIPQSELYGNNKGIVIWSSVIYFICSLIVVLFALFIRNDMIHRQQTTEKKKIGQFKGQDLYINMTLGRRVFSMMLVCTLVVAITSAYAQTLLALSNALDISNAAMTTLENQIASSSQTENYIEDYYNQHYISKAKLFAYIFDQDPSFLNESSNRYHTYYDENGVREDVIDDKGNYVKSIANSSYLQQLCDNNGIKSISVFNDQGYVIATNTSDWYFSLSHNEEDQSYEFLDLLDGKVDELVQEVQVNDDGEESQYIGVSFYYYTSLDEHGETKYISEKEYEENYDDPNVEMYHSFIQIGLYVDDKEQALETSSEEYICENLEIPYDGYLMIYDDSDDHRVIYSPYSEYIGLKASDIGVSDKAFLGDYNGFQSFDGNTYFETFHTYDGYFISTNIPTSDLYQGRTLLAIITGVISLIFLVLVSMMVTITTSREEILFEMMMDPNSDVSENIFEIMMPTGVMKVSTTASSRWSQEFNWRKKTPEQKIIFVIKAIVLIILLFILIRSSDFNSLKSESIEKFILSGKWERGVNIFSITASIIVIFLTFLGVSIINTIISLMSHTFSTKTETVAHLLISLFKYGGAIASIFYCLYLVGFDTKSLLTSASILSLVVGLGAQSMISDIIAGIFIVFEGEFQVGDIVTISDFRGQVLDIGLRTTKIQNTSGNIKIFNNSNISGLLNMTRELSFAAVTISIDYDQDLLEVEKVLEKELPTFREKIPDLKKDPTYLGVSALSESSVDLLIVGQCKEKSVMSVTRKMTRELFLTFKRYGIEVPFNQIVVSQRQVVEQIMEDKKYDKTV